MTLVSIFAGAFVVACLLVRLVAMPRSPSCTAPVAMLAPPRARRLGPGRAATKNEANTHSNARFGREVEWNVLGTNCFLWCRLSSRQLV